MGNNAGTPQGEQTKITQVKPEDKIRVKVEHDYLNFVNEPKITNNLDSAETIVYSSKVYKVNDYGFWQERTLLLTNKQLYNIKYTTFQRDVRLKFLEGLTKSNDEESKEFVIHVLDQYDYRYKFNDNTQRDILFQCLKEVYFASLKKDLPCYGVPEKSLADYTTNKKDVKNS